MSLLRNEEMGGRGGRKCVRCGYKIQRGIANNLCRLCNAKQYQRSFPEHTALSSESGTAVVPKEEIWDAEKERLSMKNLYQKKSGDYSY